MAHRLLIFDMDGVLVDVNDSYRQTISETVKLFTGEGITKQEIQALKNRGQSNNDWDLTHEIVRSRGKNPPKETVIAEFQKIYLGDHNNGLISKERWLPRNGLLERLSQNFRLALFTGRERWEAAYTIAKFAPGIVFEPIVGMENVQREKPDPEGLLKILDQLAPDEVFYIGDVMDDCRAALGAHVSFIGVVAEDNPLGSELESLFRGMGSHAVIPSINELESVLPSWEK